MAAKISISPGEKVSFVVLEQNEVSGVSILDCSGSFIPKGNSPDWCHLDISDQDLGMGLHILLHYNVGGNIYAKCNITNLKDIFLSSHSFCQNLSVSLQLKQKSSLIGISADARGLFSQPEEEATAT